MNAYLIKMLAYAMLGGMTALYGVKLLCLAFGWSL